MTTKKTKKKDSTTLEMPGTIGGAKVVLPENQSSGGWPKISQGTHLTVKTFEDGRTELVWDDEQLLKEVQEAIASRKFEYSEPKTIVNDDGSQSLVVTVTKKTKGKKK